MIWSIEAFMKLKESIKPISYMKTHAADILLTVSETHRPIIITHNGVGKMVIQDIESYEKIKERLTLLKIAALGKRAVEEGDFRPAKEVFRSIEKQRKRNA